MTRLILEAALVAIVSAYSVGDGHTPGHGITASGKPVEAGVTLAADLKHHPLGTRIWLEGVGWRTVTDTGGAIKGRDRFDLYVPDIDDAIQWGRRRVAYQVAAPVYSPKLYRNGEAICHGAPMPDGFYSARHCLEGRPFARYTTDGTEPLNWSVDPTRDLAHFVGLRLPGAVMRASVPGEYANWANDKTSGRLRRVESRRYFEGSPWCVVDGRIIRGDSGSGIWAESDGALVGVLIEASQLDGALYAAQTPECGWRQTAVTVEVP